MDFLGNLLRSKNPLIPSVSEFLVTRVACLTFLLLLRVLRCHFCPTVIVCWRVPWPPLAPWSELSPAHCGLTRL